MEGNIHFSFRDKDYSASYLICSRQEPIYIFVFFRDKELVQEFGEEICMHISGDKLLHDNIYSGKRLHLYTEIFSQVMISVRNDHPAQTLIQNTHI